MSDLMGPYEGWVPQEEYEAALARLAATQTVLRAARGWIADGSENAGHLLGRIDDILESDPAAEEQGQ